MTDSSLSDDDIDRLLAATPDPTDETLGRVLQIAGRRRRRARLTASACAAALVAVPAVAVAQTMLDGDRPTGDAPYAREAEQARAAIRTYDFTGADALAYVRNRDMPAILQTATLRIEECAYLDQRPWRDPIPLAFPKNTDAGADAGGAWLALPGGDPRVHDGERVSYTPLPLGGTQALATADPCDPDAPAMRIWKIEPDPLAVESDAP